MSESDTTGRWPDPNEEETEVMLLGTYHMANPGLDAVNVEADDVLADDRQRELEALADRLAGWEPDRIATEWPREKQPKLDAVYDAYRGEDGDPDLLDDHRRNEVVQVGCRLADRLDHDWLAAVDSPVSLDERVDDAPDRTLREEIERAARDLDAYDADLAAEKEREQRRLCESTIPEFLRHKNAEAELHANEGMFAAFLTAGDPGDERGATMLTGWYERNIRTVQNLWWTVDDDTDRVLLLIGSGHVHVLRHLLDRTPMFCPVSPLSVLDAGERQESTPTA